MNECQWEDLTVKVTRAEARNRKMKRATVRGFVDILTNQRINAKRQRWTDDNV
jgi:hypothetical protein